MAAFKSGRCLLDLPVEILDLILSYLPDIELINVRKVSVQFEQSFQRLICTKGRKLNFSRCYDLREEELIEVLESGEDYITSVNINHCYWLTADCLKLIMKLPHLKELHVIDCDISSFLQNRSIPVGLSALSVHWNAASWYALGRVNEVGTEYASQLFGNVRRLSILVDTYRLLDYSMYYIGVEVLTHCLQLETLQVYETKPWLPIDGPQLIDEPSLEYQEGLLPKLSRLSVQLSALAGIPKWLRAIFTQRKTPLNAVWLGKGSYYWLEYDPESTQLIFPCIIAEDIPVVCLDAGYSGQPELPAIPEIWLERKTPKCRVVSLQGLSLRWMSDTSRLVAEIGPQLQELNLRKCQVDINDLVMGLTTIAKHCTRLTKLDLTLDSSVLTNDDSNYSLLIAVSEFKALKALYVSIGLLSRSKNLPNAETVPGQQKTRFGSEMEISEESMRSSEMWRLTQSCMEMEDFRLTNVTRTDDRVVCESALACISNWRNLKELHLINIQTLGRGSFLPFITKNCPQLASLYLRDIGCEEMCNYMTSLIESLSHATNLKDLSIIQEMELSSMLSNALGNCQGLERLYWRSLAIKPEVCGGFIKLLSEFPKLVLVRVVTMSTTKAVMKSIVKKLKSVKSTRPCLTYCLTRYTELPTAPFKTYKSFPDDSVPFHHLELIRYF